MERPVENLLEKLKSIASSQKPPDEKDLLKTAEVANKTLAEEDESYRPRIKKIPGGLLDFCAQDLPVIVIPDLHARANFLIDILEYNLKESLGLDESVLSALENKHILVVSVGDILHSEARGFNRWKMALLEYMSGNPTGHAMTSEMAEGLNTLTIVMTLKCAYTKNFHILKGNHENILNEDFGGNWAFYKFVREGEEVTAFMEKFYGKKVLKEVSRFEKSLPLLSAHQNVLISHAEPVIAFDRNEVIAAPLSYTGAVNAGPSVVEGLTWTRNDEALPGSVKEMLKEFCTKPTARYIGGHRPVLGDYESWQEGLYIQIHNPEKENIAIVKPDRAFDPTRDIYNTKR